MAETERTKVFAGIDPSITNTGVVCVGEDGALVAAFNGHDAHMCRKSMSDVQRYAAQAERISEFLSDYDVAACGYEAYSFGSVHRAYSLAEYGGVLKYRLHLLGVVPTLIPPTVAKKFGTGRGDADKIMMSEQAVMECPGLAAAGVFSDDVCDAWFLARMAWYASSPTRAARLERGSQLLRTRLGLVHQHLGELVSEEDNGTEDCDRVLVDGEDGI